MNFGRIEKIMRKWILKDPSRRTDQCIDFFQIEQNGGEEGHDLRSRILKIQCCCIFTAHVV